MYKSFVEVNRSPINKSSSKQLYSFAKSSRFSRGEKPAYLFYIVRCIRASYDISADLNKFKNTSANFTKSQRFAYK